MMKGKNIIQAFFIIIITIIFAVYIHRNYSSIKEALRIRPSFLISLILLNVLNKIILGFKTKKIVEVFGIRLTFIEWFGSSVIVNFYNYLAPKSGTALFGVYLNTKHKLNYHKYVSLLITSSLITFLVCGILGEAANIYIGQKHLINGGIFFVIFSFLIIVPMVFFCMPRINLPDKGMFKKINNFFDGWHFLRRNKKTLFLLALMDIGIVLCMAARYLILFKMFSLDADVFTCILIAPFNIITHFATLVPGAYGVKELTVGLVSRLAGINFDSGVLATLSDRVIMMTLAFILGPVFSFLLLKKSLSFKKGASQNE